MNSDTRIQAAFFDVDGTLVSFRHHCVPESTQTAIRRLHDRGIKIFIATGRSAANLNEISMLPYDGVIGLNGTCNLLRDGSVISRHAIPQEHFSRLLTIAEKLGAAISVETGDGVFVNRMTPRVREMARMVALPLPSVGDLDRAFIPGETCQISLYVDDETERKIMSEFPCLASSRWCDAFADINVAGFDKGTGLYEIAAYSGIDMNETIAFGDGGNDIPLIRAAAVGVVMGNSGDALKKHADFVTKDIDDDGVAFALRHFGLI